MLSGYLGIRISDRDPDNLHVYGRCPERSEFIKARGVNYMGASLDVSMSCTDPSNPSYPTEASFLVTAQGSKPIYVSWSGADAVVLAVNEELKVNMSASKEGNLEFKITVL